MSIPKILHYCWFGNGEKPAIFDRCYASWQRQLPDYEIIEWNESNFDITAFPYVSQAYECGKFAFVSDYVRLAVLKEFGGVYVDTDVEVLKPLDCFLNDHAFLGYEDDSGINPGLIMGSEPFHPILDDLLVFYQNNNFIDEYGNMNTYTTVCNATNVLVAHGLKLNSRVKCEVDDVVVYPKVIFCPDELARKNGRYDECTYTVHHYSATWRNDNYNKLLKHGFFKGVVRLASLAGKGFRSILGETRWIKIRNRYLSPLYDLLRGMR